MMKKLNNLDKVILTDCDGVLLNWEYAFTVWMEHHGYEKTGDPDAYDIGTRYNLTSDKKEELIRFFNESSTIGFLPPLRDAMHYIDLLHRKHGYVFHMITSLSLDPTAQALRIKNTNKLFGKTAFEQFIFTDTGADKDEVLAPYENSGYIWVEDKIENAELGDRLGLESIIMEHSHNMLYEQLPVMKNWKEIYNYIVG